MSRALKSTRFASVALGTGLAGLAAVLAVAGCSAGQDTQTDSVLPAVNGAAGQAGPIAIRDAQFATPRGGVYPAGGEAELVLTIVNTGAAADELTEVSSSVAGQVEVRGDRSLPAFRAIMVGTPGREASGSTSSSVVTTTRTPSSGPSVPSSAPSSGASSAPSSAGSASSSVPSSSSSVPSSATEPVELGKATIILKGLTSPLQTGRTYPVTFVFRNAGSVTLELPIATPATARPAPTSGGSHG